MLYDKARIFVQAGRGGDGSQSFRREAHVPRGGPDGGDGGRGGDVVLRVDDSMRDLQTFKRKAHYKARPGTHGQGSNRFGAEGESLEIRVPPGTIVTAEDGTVHDLVRPGQRIVVARGGPYGRGNKRFATATRQAPKFREFGLPGEEGWLELQLKLLADVGLVGLPNAGKSSLLKRLTRADPKVASYPFTTLEPHLGTIEREGRQIILADIPGLIEGASDGAGLGHDFLAHVERTRTLVHVLDLAPLDGSDPGDNHALIEAELAAYDARLAALPRVLALSKADLVPEEDAQAAVDLWREELGDEIPIIVTSSATGRGLDELVSALFERVPVVEAPPEPLADGLDDDALAEHQTFRPVAQRGFTIEQIAPDAYRVVGAGIERMLARYDAENDEAMGYLEHRLSRIGVIRALEDAGFQPGDEVHIGDVVLELDES
jgi:GTP-binding protein